MRELSDSSLLLMFVCPSGLPARELSFPPLRPRLSQGAAEELKPPRGRISLLWDESIPLFSDPGRAALLYRHPMFSCLCQVSEGCRPSDHTVEIRSVEDREVYNVLMAHRRVICQPHTRKHDLHLSKPFPIFKELVSH